MEGVRIEREVVVSKSEIVEEAEVGLSRTSIGSRPRMVTLPTRSTNEEKGEQPGKQKAGTWSPHWKDPLEFEDDNVQAEREAAARRRKRLNGI